MTEIENTIEMIRAYADALEGVKDQFPDLSWNGAFSGAFDGNPWNHLSTKIHGGDILVDNKNISRTTRRIGNDSLSFYVEVPVHWRSFTRVILIRVGAIKNPRLCVLNHYFKAMMQVADMLVGDPKRELHRIISAIRRRGREEKQEQVAHLTAELHRLQTEQ